MVDICLLRVVDKSNSPVPQDGLQKTESIWRDEYTGTAENLVAAGIAEMHQFPGQPGRGKTMVSYRPDGTPVGRGGTDWHNEPGHKSIMKAGKNRFIVSVRVAQGEGERRHTIWLAKRNGDQRARDAQERQERMARELARIPKTVDEFRRDLISRMNTGDPLCFVRAMVTGQSPFDAGFTLDAKALRAFDALCTRMRILISSGGIEMNVQRQEAIIAEIKQRAVTVTNGAPDKKPPPRHLMLVSSRPRIGREQA